MRQYWEQRRQAGDAILLFRMGDFYELFHDDAELASRLLGIALTSRDGGRTPLAGIPYHALESYLSKLVAAGHKVAISEQIEDARQAKGVVQRAIVRVVTPGTLTDDALLDQRRANIVAAICEDGHRVGVAAAELAGGELLVHVCDAGRLADELIRLGAAEILLPDRGDDATTRRSHATAAGTSYTSHAGRHRLEPTIRDQLAVGGSAPAVTYRAAHEFSPHAAERTLLRQFEVATLEGFGFDEIDPSLRAAAAVISYLEETQKTALVHLRPPRRYGVGEFLEIDAGTLRSLEIERTLRGGTRDGSLLAAVDLSRNPMGSRLVRQWLCYPLRDPQAIRRRQNIIEVLMADNALRERLRRMLHDAGDVERRAARVGVKRTHPRELRALGDALHAMAPLRELLRGLHSRELDNLAERLEGLDGLAERLCGELSPEAPMAMREGNIFAAGVSAELDRLRQIGRDGRVWLGEYQAREFERTGISNLKIGYNRVFGYYLEVSNAHRSRVPDDYVRKQTVKNAERYITDDLKTFEREALSAESRANELEYDLFCALRDAVAGHIPQLQRIAAAVAELDVLAGWAELAVRRRCCKPEFVDEPILDIEQGRHPVVEQTHDAAFVPNDTLLAAGGAPSTSISDATPERGAGILPAGQAGSLLHPGESAESCGSSQTKDSRSGLPSPGLQAGQAAKSLALITGPNMAGKSTYIRQVALLSLLAHAGCWVPARRMTLGVVDRIFTRVGAADELSRGQSTFMVEMLETANILHNATPRSLVILDEVGRGTSTFDGVALAWAITEHLAARGCRTLFATHYHELTELAELLEPVFNLNVAVREYDDRIVFLHRILPGSADRSYGLHVAKLAGLPQEVMERAHAVLSELERSFARESQRPALAAAQRRRTRQLRLFEAPEEIVVRQLRELGDAAIAPARAAELLHQWRATLKSL